MPESKTDQDRRDWLLEHIHEAVEELKPVALQVPAISETVADLSRWRWILSGAMSMIALGGIGVFMYPIQTNSNSITSLTASMETTADRIREDNGKEIAKLNNSLEGLRESIKEAKTESRESANDNRKEAEKIRDDLNKSMRDFFTTAIEKIASAKRVNPPFKGALAISVAVSEIPVPEPADVPAAPAVPTPPDAEETSELGACVHLTLFEYEGKTATEWAYTTSAVFPADAKTFDRERYLELELERVKRIVNEELGVKTNAIDGHPPTIVGGQMLVVLSIDHSPEFKTQLSKRVGSIGKPELFSPDVDSPEAMIAVTLVTANAGKEGYSCEGIELPGLKVANSADTSGVSRVTSVLIRDSSGN